MRSRALVLLACLALLVVACDRAQEVSDDTGGVTAVLNDLEGRTYTIHGDDQLPPRPAGAPALAREEPWPCVGTGTDGRRVEMLYVHGQGTGDLAGLRATFEAYSRSIVGTFVASSQGQYRAPRLATTPDCRLLIADVTVSAAALSSFDTMIDELVTHGFNRGDRKYHAWVDANAYCGIGTVYEDDRPGSENWNNQGPSYARSDRGCWGYAEVHEIAHNLGAVQLSAPNSTGALHSRDEHDVMSYADGGPKGQMVVLCPEPVGEDRLDCRGDDYFSPAPSGYLASHWNVASSAWLATTAGTVPPTTVPPTPTTVPPTTPPTTTGQGKTETDLTISASPRVGSDVRMLASVTGSCRPEGTVSFFISGRLMSRQTLRAGQTATAALTVRFSEPGRYTVRADYGGSPRCAKSADSSRPRVR